MNESFYARALVSGTTLAVVALATAAESSAQDLTFEVRGVVASNTLTSGPLTAAVPGEASALRFTIDLGTLDSGTTHVFDGGCPFGICGGSPTYNYSTFDIDMSTVQLTVGGVSLAASPAPVAEATFVNNYGGRDPFALTVPLTTGAGFARVRVHAPENFVTFGEAPVSSTGVTTIVAGTSPVPGSFEVLGAVLGEALQITPTEIETMSLFALSCHGDGGAGLGCTDCPCSNSGTPGHPGGCLNSTGTSVLLYGEGTASVTSDSFQLRVKHSRPGTFGYLASGGNQLAPPGCPSGSGVQNAFDDGLRCTGGAVRRHGPRVTFADGEINQYFGLVAQGGFTAGQVRHFQYFYRDDISAGCQTGRNSSNALTVTVVP